MAVEKKLSDILADAIAAATIAHQDQRRWDGRPYILHCLNVMRACLPGDNSTPSPQQYKRAIVAVLHDVVEDTDTTLGELAYSLNLSDDMIQTLDLLTKEDYPKDATIEEIEKIYQDYINKISCCPEASFIKLCDLRDNMNILGPPEGKKISGRRMDKYRKAYFHLRRTICQ